MYAKKHKPFAFLCFSCFCFVAAYALSSDPAHSSFFASNTDVCTGDNCPLQDVDILPSKPNLQRAAQGFQRPEEINVIITFTNAEMKHDLHNKFKLTISSLFTHSSVRVRLFVIGDPTSQKIASDILEKNVQDANKYMLASLDVDELAKKLEAVVRPMQERFSYKPGAYYSHVLFFLSTALHRVMPESIHRVIMIDADLKFTGDIAELYDQFQLFSAENIMGIARDAQPVYRHAFWQYRQEHPGTRVGEPPPDGLTGFNSGVLLLDLDRMRSSAVYNSLLDATAIVKLADEFHFKGHLGDQDFFTLVSMRHEELFYVLPCQWNRQLCRWWGDHGYEDVFDQYFKCDADVKIYHGNCNTPIP